VAVSVAGSSGDLVRVAFGYAENGAPSSLFCTTRQETCWTSSTATSSNPYVFAGEAQAKTPCGSGCTISIPAIPGRVVYYQTERTNGTTVTAGPLQSVAVP
jgi:hypothetical protein